MIIMFVPEHYTHVPTANLNSLLCLAEDFRARIEVQLPIDSA